MPHRVWSPPQLASSLLVLCQVFLAVGFATIAPSRRRYLTRTGSPKSLRRKTAWMELRRFATNIQFHKDQTVRLVRLSKPIVSDEHLIHLKQFSKLDYLAVLCPEVTDEGHGQRQGTCRIGHVAARADRNHGPDTRLPPGHGQAAASLPGRIKRQRCGPGPPGRTANAGGVFRALHGDLRSRPRGDI